MRSPLLNDRPGFSHWVVRPAWLRWQGLVSSIGLGAGALTSCCVYMACEGVNGGSYSEVYCQFSGDTLSGAGFTRAQVQQAYVVRYRDEQLTQPQDSQSVTHYSVNQGYRMQPAGRLFCLALVADSLPRHPAYRVVVAGKRFALNHFSLEITEEKPCNCLHLRNVDFTLNNQPTVVAQDGRELVPVILSR